jgi:hypothetical protein
MKESKVIAGVILDRGELFVAGDVHTKASDDFRSLAEALIKSDLEGVPILSALDQGSSSDRLRCAVSRARKTLQQGDREAGLLGLVEHTLVEQLVNVLIELGGVHFDMRMQAFSRAFAVRRGRPKGQAVTGQSGSRPGRKPDHDISDSELLGVAAAGSPDERRRRKLERLAVEVLDREQRTKAGRSVHKLVRAWERRLARLQSADK